MIVGTAGHIDHGKTTLVRALTGVDTDRLKEEKARGISIELGYAYTPLPNGDVLGFIDVPGHERLIHTMAAGASGIDLALLVVAADDGVMPQTREHVAIIERLGVARAVVALTKVDRADAARVQAVRAEIDALLATTPFAGAPVFAVNATDTADGGVAALNDHLHAQAQHLPARTADGLFRLAVDRVFTLPGHGTVVTGTVFGGQVRTGDTMALAPSGLPVRVRSIHAQQRAADVGVAGQRCALNLAGVDKDQIARGDWVVDSALVVPSTRLDVSVGLLADAGVHLGHWSPVHVHLGTTHRIANLVMLTGDTLQPGGGALAQLVFAAPLCAVAGDHFIVRNAQATRTIGGGQVLDPFAPDRKRRTPQRLAYLHAIEAMLLGGGITPLLIQAARGISVARLKSLTGTGAEQWHLPSDVQVIGTGDGTAPHGGATLILSHHWQALQRGVLDTLEAFHARKPDEPGPDKASLRRIAFSAGPVADGIWNALVDTLVGEGELVRNGAWLRLPLHSTALSALDEDMAESVLPRLDEGRYDPPWVRDHGAALHVPETAMRHVLRALARQGRAHQVVNDLFYATGRIDELAALVASLAMQHGRIEAVQFRDASGLGRKRAIQILEFFDRVGYTRRVGNARMLRPDTAWFLAQGAAVAGENAGEGADGTSGGSTSPSTVGRTSGSTSGNA